MKRSSFSLGPWSKIHTPLPRTPRQSQQLLNALTSSFRRELDREHPPTASSSGEHSKYNDVVAGKREVEDHSHSSSHAADKHFGAILDNPLFRLPPGTHSPNNETAVLQKEPMVTFDQLVASGAATPGAVMNCLSWQLLLTSRHSGERFLKEMKDSRAGSRTVSWWFSSARRTKMAFLKSDRVDVVCKFMAAEGLHDKVFAWLKFLANSHYEDEVGQTANVNIHAVRDFRFRTLLGCFLKADIECGGGLESSMRYYLNVCQMFMPTSDVEPHPSMRTTLGRAGQYLLSLIMMRQRDIEKNAIPAYLYEDYTAIIKASSRSRLVRSAVSIYHPTQPDARPFAQFVRQLSPSFIENMSEAQRDRITRAGFDALRVLVDAGNIRDADALCVARFLQQLVGEKHEEPASRDTHVSSEEKALLDNMELAFA
ncbi:hypothetical protein BDV18DRAFT_55842 [Aspergillus unguis]